MDVTTQELKFLLCLVAYPQEQAAIAQLRPNPNTSAAARDSLCLQLCSKGIVDYTYEVTRFAIAPAGRTLLGLDTTSLPVTPAELYTLQSCRERSISPGDINHRVPSTDRQRIIRNLEERGLVRVLKTQIKQVWLTPQGHQFLKDHCCPTGHTPVLSLSLLNNYLTFLRRAFQTSAVHSTQPSSGSLVDKPDSQQVLDQIRYLDQTLNAGNYLPIFHLRQALQPPLSREELDQRLYALQRTDQIEMSTLQDVSAYSDSQIAAGISQDIGGTLFFISIL